MGIAGTLSNILLSLLDVLGQSLSFLGFGMRLEKEYWEFSQVVLVVKNLPASAGDARDMGLIPEIGEIPWRREWLPTPVFLPGKSQRSLAGYCPGGSQRVGHG